jgi:hypothetical protein
LTQFCIYRFYIGIINQENFILSPINITIQHAFDFDSCYTSAYELVGQIWTAT